MVSSLALCRSRRADGRWADGQRKKERFDRPLVSFLLLQLVLSVCTSQFCLGTFRVTATLSNWNRGREERRGERGAWSKANTCEATQKKGQAKPVVLSGDGRGLCMFSARVVYVLVLVCLWLLACNKVSLLRTEIGCYSDKTRTHVHTLCALKDDIISLQPIFFLVKSKPVPGRECFLAGFIIRFRA